MPSTPACRSSGSTPCDALAQQPGDQPGHVAVGIDQDHGPHLPQPRHDLPVVGGDELVEMPLGDHRAVVVRHVLGDGGERRPAHPRHPLDDAAG